MRGLKSSICSDRLLMSNTRCCDMTDKMREIHCEEIACLEQGFPLEISVVRQMLAYVGEQFIEELTI